MRCSSLRFRIFSRWVCFASCATVFCRDFDPSFCLATLRCILRRPLLSTRLRSTVVPSENPQRTPPRPALMPTGFFTSSIGELCFEMVEHEAEVHAVGPAADENLKRLDTWWHTFVFETKNRQTLYTHQTLTRALINEHTSGITGIHLESLPAPGGLETRMSWGLARPDTAMECRERSVESFESGVLYAPVERSFDVREVLAYCRKRSALLSE